MQLIQAHRMREVPVKVCVFRKGNFNFLVLQFPDKTPYRWLGLRTQRSYISKIWLSHCLSQAYGEPHGDTERFRFHSQRSCHRLVRIWRYSQRRVRQDPTSSDTQTIITESGEEASVFYRTMSYNVQIEDFTASNLSMSSIALADPATHQALPISAHPFFDMGFLGNQPDFWLLHRRNSFRRKLIEWELHPFREVNSL